VVDGMLFVRTRVRLADIGGRESLGAFGRMLGDTEPFLVGGTLSMVRPGLAQYHLREVAVRDLEVPRTLVRTLVERWGPGERPQGLAPDALPVVLPETVVDVRLAPGKVTFYKKAP